MQYSVLGGSGLIVSRLAFGAGSLGVGETLPGLRKNLDGAAANRLVARAIEAGITLFDTSDVYTEGQSETFLGEALRGHRSEIVLSTKCGMRAGPAPTATGLSRRHLIESAEASLRRLQTDWIDLYHLHTVDPFTPIEEIVRGCEALVRDGKVRSIGLSNWPAWIFRSICGVWLQFEKGPGNTCPVLTRLRLSRSGAACGPARQTDCPSSVVLIRWIISSSRRVMPC